MASGTIHCTLVREIEHHQPVGETQHDLLPWADPYIASLFRDLERQQLQAKERRHFSHDCVDNPLAAEPSALKLHTEMPEEVWSLHAA